MAEKLLLQGRYFDKVRKLGLIGVSASVVSGIAAYYGFYVHRINIYKDYEKRLAEPGYHEKLDARIAGLSKYKRDPKYPDLVFPPRKDPTLPETQARAFGKFEEFQVYAFELKIFSKYGEQAKEVYTKCLFDELRRGGYFKDEAERSKARKEFASYRQKFMADFRKEYPDFARRLEKGRSRDILREEMQKSLGYRLLTYYALVNDKPVPKMSLFKDEGSPDLKLGSSKQKFIADFKDEYPDIVRRLEKGKGTEVIKQVLKEERQKRPSYRLLSYYALVNDKPELGPMHASGDLTPDYETRLSYFQQKEGFYDKMKMVEDKEERRHMLREALTEMNQEPSFYVDYYLSERGY